MRVLVISHQDDAGPGVFADVLDTTEAIAWRPGREPAPALDGLDAAVVLGAAANVHEVDAHPWLAEDGRVVSELIERRVPTLGVCLGAQLVAQAAGGSVRRAPEPEIGWYEVRLTDAAAGDPVLGDLPPAFSSFQWHSYEAVPPPEASVLAVSDSCLQAFRLSDAPAWGIQFHAEVAAPDVRHWIDSYEVDPDAVRMGIDPEAMWARTEPALDEWNEIGRGLCARFLEAAYSGVT
jgi:GMP synthase-like glutamine amidotransferase